MKAASAADDIQTKSAMLATRMIWHEFPEIQSVLADDERRKALVAIMLSSFSTAAEQMENSLRRQKEDLENARSRIPEAVPAIKASISPRQIHSGSHLGLLLTTYAAAAADSPEERGLTNTEAFRASGLPEGTCYWKRANELLTMGYLELVRDSGGKPLRRFPDANARTKQRVSVITAAGQAVVLSWG